MTPKLDLKNNLLLQVASLSDICWICFVFFACFLLVQTQTYTVCSLRFPARVASTVAVVLTRESVANG